MHSPTNLFYSTVVFNSHLAPKGLVQFHIHTDILGPHHLYGELLDFLHGAGCAFLEGNSMKPLVEVDGVLTGSHRLLELVLCHLHNLKEAANGVS